MPERRPALALLLTAALGTVAWAWAQQAAPTTATPATPPPPATAPAPSLTSDVVTAHEKAGRCVEGSEQACMDLVRQGKDGKEHRIMVIRTGTSDDTGIYAVCTPPEGEPEDAPNIGIFSESGPGGIRIVIDRNLIRVPLAEVAQLPAKEGQTGSDGKVEASKGTARFLDDVPEGKTDRLSRCGVEAERQPAPGTVFVTQGKTQLVGQSLVYDGADGIARIDGPITFNRTDQKDPLSGESRQIEINVDSEATVLVGDVVLRSKGGRVSRASRVEYDDQANTARLYASPEQPAESVRGSDSLKITSGVIVYNLERNEVYANAGKEGNISGEFLDGTPPSAP
ncbi:LptA/OstA family protein [Deinococcus sp. VB343]|uniref:LptA/OstA family protein n=1 Tax=Deinococcus sp. VB343 TaxID=3385567 RepID=UPI0039C97778